MQKIINYLFCGLLFLVPLILWPHTSEVFEFNKIVVTYVFTTLIVGAWAIRMIIENKFILRRTLLDIPLLVFLTSQIISTILSIDPSTSFFGYYSRFNGGLLSTICYSLLYWAFVSNLNQKQALFTVHCSLFTAVLVSLYGVAEHFGIDKHVWVQDVQSRVFSTLGQPNWLAAYLVALIPISFTIYHLPFNILLSSLFFTTLLFTKSRSGLLGFIVAMIIYWSFILFKNFKNNLKPFLISNFSFLILALIIGTQFTPNLSSLVNHSVSKSVIQKEVGPALETGGTESGEIRKIVWKGALDIFKNYPVFGTGVETFAFSYYQFRPIAHNMVSEWDFIYNKAHNEFLNIMANSGIFGITSYLVLVIYSIIQMIKSKKYDFLAGVIGLHITNFFGFSVVPTQLQLFLFPAISLVLSIQYEVHSEHKKQLITNQKLLIFCILGTAYCVLFAISKYWYSDYLYNLGKNYNSANKPDIAIIYLQKAIKNAPKQALYHNELATSYTTLSSLDKNYTEKAASETKIASTLSPKNINVIKSQFGVYIRLSEIDTSYAVEAKKTLDQAILMAPNDPRLIYNLGLMFARSGQFSEAVKILEKAIELKPNYDDPKRALEIINQTKEP